jgi:hypothetical protein
LEFLLGWFATQVSATSRMVCLAWKKISDWTIPQSLGHSIWWAYRALANIPMFALIGSSLVSEKQKSRSWCGGWQLELSGRLDRLKRWLELLRERNNTFYISQLPAQKGDTGNVDSNGFRRCWIALCFIRSISFKFSNRRVHSIDSFDSNPTSMDMYLEFQEQYISQRGGSYSQRQAWHS